jgi:hypothetical protein
VGPLLHDAFHDDRGGEPLHAGQGGEVLVAEGLVGGDVGGGDAEEVVGVAEEPFGVADLGDLGQAAFEVGDRGGVLSVHRHLDQDLEAEADRGGIDDGSVAADRSGPFQLAQSSVAGSHTEPDPLGSSVTVSRPAPFPLEARTSVMGDVLDYLPIAAAAFAIP